MHPSGCRFGFSIRSQLSQRQFEPFPSIGVQYARLPVPHYGKHHRALKPCSLVLTDGFFRLSIWLLCLCPLSWTYLVSLALPTPILWRRNNPTSCHELWYAIYHSETKDFPKPAQIFYCFSSQFLDPDDLRS